MRGMVIEKLLTETNKLMNECIGIKKKANDINIKSIAKEVADHVDDWLSRPYEDKKTERQDINDFALRMTRYINHRLRD